MRIKAARLAEHGQPLRIEEAAVAESGEIMSAAIQGALEGLANGQLTVPIGSVLPLERVNDAFDQISQRSARGKIVLDTTS